MKQVFLAAACVAVMAAPAAAQTPDASGAWDGIINVQAGSYPVALVLKKSAEKLSGTISGEQGEVAIEGTQKGAAVEIWFTIQTSNGPLDVAMSGTHEGDTMKGSVDLGGMGQGDWSAKRAPAAATDAAGNAKTSVDVSGPWDLQIDTGAGTGSPSVTFTQDGETLTGQYKGQFGESAVTGTVKGSDITFQIELNVQGTAVTVVYSGVVDKDTMKGTVKLGDMGEGTFTGKKH